MRITGFNIHEGRIGGLKSLKADKLGSIVVLAGRNGMGKSRLIQFLSSWKEAKSIKGMPLDLNTPQGFLKYASERNEKSQPLNGRTWNNWCEDLEDLKNSIDSWRLDKVDIKQVQSVLLELHFNSENEPQIIHFVPKITGLADPQAQTKTDLIKRSENVSAILGIAELEHHALARIQHLQNRYVEATHQNCKHALPTIEQIKRDYETLQSLIQKFLGACLERNEDGDAMLFGLRIGDGNYSDGQSILLQFCVAIHAQAERLSELIVMMDEPENHLHPAAMLDAINEIQRHLTNGQLWIATHSLPLLANFDPDCIWWMDDGSISHAGSNPETVLQGLVGGIERIERLENFLGLPASMAINNFTAQCLLPPAVVMTGNEDKQIRQIQSSLMGLRREGKPLRVLDVGAGRGRLISALAATWPTASHELDYLAFDPLPTHQKECEDAIARCYVNEAEQRWFGKESELKAKHNAQSVDVAVMCNVLHEIDPSRWVDSLFGPHGIAGHFLAKDGFLLIVEDTEMRIGEKAYDNGFLVLNTGNLRTLFSISEKDHDFQFDAQQDGRLLATLVPANCLQRANNATLKTTLEQVCHEASQAIRDIRQANAGSSYRNGRKLAFHMQQFANACLSKS